MSNTPIVPAVGSVQFSGAQGAASPSLGGPCRQSPGLPGGLFSNYNIAGAIVVKSSPGILASLICTTSGSVTIHDCATAAAACAGNLIGTIAMTSGQAPLALNWPCSYGIYVSNVSAGLFSIAFT
jgi:hypothetical protein